MSPIGAGPYSAKFFEVNRRSGSRSAAAVIPLLLELLDPFKPHSVVDVGCGSGSWAAACLRHGIADVVGVDGDYVNASAMELPPSHFVARDLTRPLQLGRTFDLAISLEVGEHLPRAFSEALIESLVGLSSLVLFSAALPYQGGANHLNEQWPEYWVHRFRARGYAVADLLRLRLWDDDRVDWWYAQNILLFVDKDRLIEYSALVGKTADHAPALVHPKNYLHNLGLRRSLARMPLLVTKAIRRRMSARWW